MSAAEPRPGVLVFVVSGMHCASCGLLIDDTLEEEVPGVARAETDFGRARTVVTLSEPAASADELAEQILAAIAEAGYSARVVD